MAERADARWADIVLTDRESGTEHPGNPALPIARQTHEKCPTERSNRASIRAFSSTIEGLTQSLV